jgi:chemotaxis methyl-accepting protein methylase
MHPEVHPALLEHDEAFVHQILRTAGLRPEHYKPGTLFRRLPACLRALRANTTGAARRHVETAPAVVPVALDALMIGVTSFFRDACVFARLRDELLPQLIDETGGQLRVWSAGCSEGHELYSVAVLLSEASCLLRSRLVGTDCRATAVASATAGVFSAAEMLAMPTALRDRYFVPHAGGSEGAWRALNVLRCAMQFRAADVLQQAEPGLHDVILCRNLSIYLQPNAAMQLWQCLEAALRPGGVLVLGKAETPTGATRLSQVAPGLFRRSRGQ